MVRLRSLLPATCFSETCINKSRKHISFFSNLLPTLIMLLLNNEIYIIIFINRQILTIGIILVHLPSKLFMEQLIMLLLFVALVKQYSLLLQTCDVHCIANNAHIYKCKTIKVRSFKVRSKKRSSSVNQFMKTHSCEVSSDRGGYIYIKTTLLSQNKINQSASQNMS